MKVKDEDFYNLMNNDEDNEDEKQEQLRSQKKRMKQILTFGFNE